MGQDGAYDCSGLIIYSLSKVLGRPVEDWSPSLRHTRQMWALREGRGEFASSEEVYGDLLVFRRQWNMPGGEDRWVAAHLGIITGFDETGVPILLQAQARDHKVVERPIRTTANILGILRLCDLVAPVAPVEV